MPGDRPLNTLQEIEQALADLSRLTPNELEKICCSINHLSTNQRHRFFSELVLCLGDRMMTLESAMSQNRAAIMEFDASARASMRELRGTVEEFDKSSRRLTRWLIALTIILIILTGVIAWFTILLALKR